MIIANRMYQLAICKWKMKQYGVHSQQVSWHEVDTDINEAILAFQHLCDSKGVPMCLDLIVKLILMRSICNGQQRKFITAQRIAQAASDILD